MTASPRLSDWRLAVSDCYPARRTAYFEAEAAAVSINVFTSHCVAGLLQTEAYARAVLRSALPHVAPSMIERLVEIRMDRQWRAFERPEPLRFDAIIDESVLYRILSGPSVLLEQLQHLLVMMRSPFIRVRVLGFSAGYFPDAQDLSLFFTEEGTHTTCIEDVLSTHYVTDSLSNELLWEIWARTSERALEVDESRRIIEKRVAAIRDQMVTSGEVDVRT